MTNLTLRIGCLTNLVKVPLSISDGATEIVSHFRDASDRSINLRVDLSMLDMGNTSSIPTSTVDMHIALRELTGGAPDTIGLLLCNRFAPERDIFGIMFDTGFAIDNSLVDSRVTGRPREGCAVFLDAIADRRRGAAYIDQVLYTSIHELGHVFNLGHEENEPNFMKTSQRSRAYGSDHYRFTDPHCTRLSRGRDPSVWPGGSNFGDEGLHHVEDHPFKEPYSDRFGLALRLNLCRQSFDYFDPVELDVELSAKVGQKSQHVLANVVDPGYRTFRIWIEEPDGSRRLYQPPRHYCWSGRKLTVSAQQSFLRDISFFGESGAYTFRRAGVHKVWAELALPHGRYLKAQPIEFEIRARRWIASEKEALFTDRKGRLLLYHRVLRRSASAVSKFRGYLDNAADDPSAPSVRYALGRALLERSQRLKRSKGTNVTREGHAHLAKAIDSEFLGKRQRQVAEDMLSQQ